MADDYQQYLEVGGDDFSYDVGFHPEWDTLRLHVVERSYDCDNSGSVQLFLRPHQARELGQALLAAAFSLSQKQKSRV